MILHFIAGASSQQPEGPQPTDNEGHSTFPLEVSKPVPPASPVEFTLPSVEGKKTAFVITKTTVYHILLMHNVNLYLLIFTRPCRGMSSGL